MANAETNGLMITLERRDLTRTQWKWLWRSVRLAKKDADRKVEACIHDLMMYGSAVIKC